MLKQRDSCTRFIALALAGVLFALSAVASADPPVRVARVGYVTGPVSFSPAGEEDWVEAPLNRPLGTGDRLWADTGARVELQIGSAAIRLGALTSITLLNLDDRVAQIQLAQGMLNLRVRRIDPDALIEIDTPNLAYVIRQPGHYRVSVDADGGATRVSTSSGNAEVYGEDASYVVDAGSAYRFAGTGLRDYERVTVAGDDEFDRWSQERDRGYDNSISARYVSPEVIGSQDLDAYGTWRAVPQYGNVWVPTRAGSDWAPYRDGRWAWVDPWGWTWVDDAPWGFAVSHYGRWANIGGGWGWVPGPVAARAVYAPALVVFVGGSNFQAALGAGSVGAVAWFPLGPRDVYRPAYTVSRTYFTNVNVSNTVINTTNVTNVYNNRSVTDVTYVNQQVPGAMVTVPTTTFVQSQSVARAAMRVPHDVAVRAQVTAIAAVAPMPVSVRGAAPQGAKPPPQALDRRVVAKSVPPPAPVTFAVKERAMAGNPGKPIDPATLATLKPATPAAAPKVEVIAPSRVARPAATPPPQAAHTNARGNDEPKHQPGPAITKAPVTTQPMQPPAAPVVAAAPHANASAPAPAPPQPPPKSETRVPAIAPAPVAPAATVARAPQTTAPTPVQTSPQQPMKIETRVAPPEPARVAPPTTVARQPPFTAPAPVQAPPQQPARSETRATPSRPPPVVAPPFVAKPPQVNAPVQAAPAAKAPAVQGAAPEQHTAPAVARKPASIAPPPPGTVVRSAEPPKAAGTTPKGEPPATDSRPSQAKKFDDAGKGTDESKQK